MTNEELDIEAINLPKGTAVASDGKVCPITNMFNSGGEETTDHEEAVVVLVKHSEDKWFSCKVEDYHSVAMH